MSSEDRFNAERAIRELSRTSDKKLARMGARIEDQQALYLRLRTEMKTLRSLVSQMRQEAASLKATVRGAQASRPQLP